VASASDDGTVQVWNPITGLQYWSQPVDDYAFAVAWSPDGKYVAGGGQHGTVTIFASGSGKTIATLDGQTNFIEGLAWSPDGKRVAFGDGDGTVQVWDSMTDKLLMTCSRHQGAVAHVALSPDGTRLASAGADGTVRIWDAASCRQLLMYSGQGEPVWAVAWSPDGKYIASGTGAAGQNGPVKTHNSVKVWNAQTGKTLLTYAPDAGEYYAVSWSPDGKYIVTGGDDHIVSVFDSTSGRTIQIYREHIGTIWTAVWSPDGMKMASGDQIGTAQIWKPAVG
jgi:WD40 repeat protein